MNLIWPYPEQSKEDKEAGDKFLKKLEEFLKANQDIAKKIVLEITEKNKISGTPVAVGVSEKETS